MSMTNASLGEVPTVRIAVDPSDIRAEVSRTLYGTCLEDVNHEIYGGLDAQRLYDESFEETQPFAPLPHDIEGASGKVCGRQWTEIANGGGESALDDTTAHWGRSSQRLSPGAGTAGVANAGLNGWGIPCRKGMRMIGRFFAKGEVRRLEVRLESRDGGATYAATTLAQPLPVGCASCASMTRWKRVVPSPLPASGSSGIAGNGDDASPESWRKVEFALVPDATDPAARFAIVASGGGTVWIDDVFLADWPTNEFGRLGCREDIVAALRREGVTFLRWGGSMVNSPDYLLKNMTGERRPYDGYWFRTSSTGFMVREFVRLADAMRLPCAVSIHAYDVTEDAFAFAKWLRQFDGFICVQIGNEECVGFTPAGGQPTIPDTRRYCEQVRRLVPAMRAANPRLVFASAMMWQPDKPDLMEEAFRLTDGLVEYWDLHVGAYQPDAGKGTRETIDGFREMARRLNPETTMKAAIFEENARIHNMRRALAHVDNLAAAREAGGFLLTSCPANALQPWGQNDNGWDQGQIFFTPDKVWLQPCAWAQKMASESHRDLLVAANSDSPEIKVSATRDREGKSIVLHLANPTDSARRAELRFAGEFAWRLVRTIVLAASSLDDENTPDEPDRISPKDATEDFHTRPVLPPCSYTVLEFEPDTRHDP